MLCMKLKKKPGKTFFLVEVKVQGASYFFSKVGIHCLKYQN